MFTHLLLRLAPMPLTPTHHNINLTLSVQWVGMDVLPKVSNETIVRFHSSTVFNIKTNLPHNFLTFPSHKIFFFVVVSLVVMMASSFSSSFFITRPVLLNGRDSYCSISTPSRRFQITTTHLILECLLCRIIIAIG